MYIYTCIPDILLYTTISQTSRATNNTHKRNKTHAEHAWQHFSSGCATSYIIKMGGGE